MSKRAYRTSVAICRANKQVIISLLIFVACLLPLSTLAASYSFNDGNSSFAVGMPNPKYSPIRVKQTKSDLSEEELRANAREYWRNFLLLDRSLFAWSNKTIDEAGVASIAKEITAQCSSDREKIFEVVRYLSDNLYYDFDYYEDRKEDVYIEPRDVMRYRYTICDGFARTARALLQSAGVVCIRVGAPGHAFNAAWDGSRWIFFDATWCSMNQYRFGKMIHKGINMSEWYDFTFEYGLTNTCHIIKDLPITVGRGVLVSYDCDKSDVSMSNVTAIGERVFCFNQLITSIDIPNATSVGERAFYNCDSLRSVCLNKVVSIGSEAFSHCDVLTVVETQNVENIGMSAFCNCPSLKSIDLLKVKHIEDLTFAHCVNLEYADLKNVVYAGEKAFYACKVLQTELDTLREIGDQAFAFCKRLTGVNLQNAQVIGEKAFYVCKALKNAYVLSAQNIGSGAFDYCDKSLTIHVYRSSYADDYAKSNNLKRKYIAKPNKPYAIRINAPSTIYLNRGSTLVLNYSLIPAGVNAKLKWKTSNKYVANVNSNGAVYAANPGTAVITVVTNNKKKASVTVVVQ